MQRYEYHVVPFIGRITTASLTATNASTVGGQLQHVINHYARYGWEYLRLDKVGVEVTHGCLAGLFGPPVSFVSFDQLIFRRPQIQATEAPDQQS